MKIYFKIDGRSTGKTSLAIYEFLKDPVNTLLFTNERLDMYKKLKPHKGFSDSFSEVFKNVMTYSIDGVRSRSTKRIIFDNFFSFKNYKDLWASAIPAVYEEIYVFSSFEDLSEDWEFVDKVMKNNPQAALMPAVDEKYHPKEISVCLKVDGKEIKLFEDFIPQIIVDQLVKNYRNVGKENN